MSLRGLHTAFTPHAAQVIANLPALGRLFVVAQVVPQQNAGRMSPQLLPIAG